MEPKIVLITGCSEGGIGDKLAQVFHRRGHKVFATARNLTKVEHLRAMGMATIQLDVVNPKSVKEAVAQVTKITGGKLDILINNSGAGMFSIADFHN